MDNAADRFAPFAERAIQFLGITPARDYSIKIYSVVYGHGPLNKDLFEPGFAMAARELPQPAVDAGRPGLGFVIFHQGQTGDYVVLCWWDRENELPTRVFVRDERGWRAARASESVCVWDLEILWHERGAYVATLLSPRVVAPGAAYLARPFQPPPR
jgi:hypothetical protein